MFCLLPNVVPRKPEPRKLSKAVPVGSDTAGWHHTTPGYHKITRPVTRSRSIVTQGHYRDHRAIGSQSICVAKRRHHKSIRPRESKATGESMMRHARKQESSAVCNEPSRRGSGQAAGTKGPGMCKKTIVTETFAKLCPPGGCHRQEHLLSRRRSTISPYMFSGNTVSSIINPESCSQRSTGDAVSCG